ncbi:ornithine cyclodeaminase family protein [Novosphingobium sp.]|uniref:ornithine cyclodeaminase family protein n=1 Tax=Novosphingobium sp. TaxID=1874826 RepID=UPI0028B0F9F2|nr:ornithine cyclodeaminase family protein [Novosphingobium sp.]
MLVNGDDNVTGSTLPHYSAAHVARLLDTAGCIGAVRQAMADYTASGMEQPLRQIATLEGGKMLASMPGMLAAPHGLGAKLITVFPDPARSGRAAHRGVVVLFDRDNGEPVCLADAGEITERRTAAASAVATAALARSDARRLLVMGTGLQARSHVHAISQVRKLDEIALWGRNPDTAEMLAKALSAETGIPVRAVTDARSATAHADIVCTVTSSATPVLFSEWVRPGTHINLVGSSYAGPVEVDNELVARARYVADTRRSVLAAGAEFLAARDAGLIDDTHIVAEIGEVLLGTVAGRRNPEEVTIYKSLGHVVQDLAATQYVHARAGANR